MDSSRDIWKQDLSREDGARGAAVYADRFIRDLRGSNPQGVLVGATVVGIRPIAAVNAQAPPAVLWDSVAVVHSFAPGQLTRTTYPCDTTLTADWLLHLPAPSGPSLQVAASNFTLTNTLLPCGNLWQLVIQVPVEGATLNVTRSLL